MSSTLFNKKLFIAVPPDKGSFPLDHEGVCKDLMTKYMNCLYKNDGKNSECRKQAKDYLGCRMDNNLMAKESWSSLGMKEFDEEDKKQNKDQTVKSNS